jgi:hypothetical protein
MQEQVVEPRFGFDEPDPDAPESYGGVPAGWQDMAWTHVVRDKAAYDSLVHIRLAGPDTNAALANLTLDGATWGLDAAHMARVTMQSPVRVAVHARRMLPADLRPAAHPIEAVRADGDRVVAVGGVDRFGEAWRLDAADAIAAIQARARAFEVETAAGAVPVVVADPAGGEPYLSTGADGKRPTTLLELPELQL